MKKSMLLALIGIFFVECLDVIPVLLFIAYGTVLVLRLTQASMQEVSILEIVAIDELIRDAYLLCICGFLTIVKFTGVWMRVNYPTLKLWGLRFYVLVS